MAPFDDSLAKWADLVEQQNWTGILVGNGASQAVWPAFGYTSLFTRACSNHIAHPLSEDDQAIFHALETNNFEEVLGAIGTTIRVLEASGKKSFEFKNRYESIQTALIETVSDVHVTKTWLSDDKLFHIKDALLDYSSVYSTNYDLLIYWAIMVGGEYGGFVDFFWTQDLIFDVANVKADPGTTKILYLHGAIHLIRLEDGRVQKRKSNDQFTLLEKFKTDYPSGAVPLFISEGSADQKERAIQNSPYLSFALSELADHVGPLVIFGHQLGHQDRHLVRAIRQLGDLPIAISIHHEGLSSGSIAYKKGDYSEAFPQAELDFFEATSHPLGDTFLKTKKIGKPLGDQNL